MSFYLSFGSFRIPAYGCFIVFGVVTANLIALHPLKRYRLDGNDFLITEAYVFLGAFLGAKLLYLAVHFSSIDWSQLTDFSYLNQVMQGGFVFYGGLAGGLALLLVPLKLHHIDIFLYIRHFIFLIPWIHAWGRIGCHLAGCCYGRPWQGAMAVIYPAASLAPSGVALFPVQLTEAVGLLIIAGGVFWLDIRKGYRHTVAIYLLFYSIWRFILEYFRDDAARGSFWIFSTSQWISIGLLIGTIAYLYQKQ